VAFAIGVFVLFAPLAYGNPWTQDQCKMVKLFDTWDFDCNTFYTDYAQYSSSHPNFGDVTPTVPAAQVDSGRKDDPSAVTPQAGEPNVIGREEHIEYRDQDGNLLNDAQVASLLAEGKASFETKYETRTRMVDEYGNEVNPSGVAPGHPDVEGQNPSTKGVPEEQANSKPAEANAGGSVKKEEDGKAKPASDASEATK